MNTVEVSNITKSYAKVQALQETSFTVSKGELFGIIGPDGAGKTTLFRILTTLLKPDNGKATVFGYDVVNEYKHIRKIAGYMPGKFSLYQDLSVKENLEFFATIFATTIEKNYHLIKDIYSQIEPFKDRRAGALSGGMKQKLALSCAMIHKPEILFLDEPTTGVDAVSRIEFWEMLQKLKNEGITIIVSTPYMDEASLCDRVALIQSGKILQIGKPQQIIEEYNMPLFALKSGNTYNLLNYLEKLAECEHVYPFGQYVHFIPKNKNISTEMLVNIIKKDYPEVEVTKISPNIEDCFMNLMRDV
ncbi:MAG TPA: ABC transporter ATP-binding protein [Bacteroidales bacterium]|nr:ABC transporter ATP-binding protein [Bacteroidales bacterium]HQI45552.1 ABC transporter ATP-binding protein [Bacteroidales bacterium]